MQEPTFRQVLSHSFELVWRNKNLWIFGLFSSLLGGFGLSDFFGQLYVLGGNGFVFTGLNSVVEVFQNWNVGTFGSVLLILWLLGILIMLVFGLAVVASIGRGVLISATLYWYKKEKHIKLAKAWHRGAEMAWTVFCLALLTRVMQMGILAGLSLFAFKLLGTGAVGSVYLFLLACLVAIILALAIEAICTYASGYAVLDGTTFLESFIEGWNLFKKHKLVSYEMGVVFLLLDICLVAAISYVGFVAVVPALFFWVVGIFGSWVWVMSVGMFIATILYVLLVLAIAGAYSSFVTAAWMYLFMKMHHEGVGSRVIHFIKTLFGRG